MQGSILGLLFFLLDIGLPKAAKDTTSVQMILA